MNELIALDVMNYHDENRSQTHSLAAPAYSKKTPGNIRCLARAFTLVNMAAYGCQFFLPFWTNNELTYCL